jgi:PPOX class probable F420-dependent enzyme
VTTAAKALALEPFRDTWAAALTTYKRDGTPVGTAINIAVEGDRAYFRTPSRTWKVKRLRNNPNVEIAPSDARGNPTGPAVRATARLLSGDEAKHAGELIDRKYRITQRYGVRILHRLLRWQTLHYELVVRDEPAREAEGQTFR